MYPLKYDEKINKYFLTNNLISVGTFPYTFKIVFSVSKNCYPVVLYYKFYNI